MDRDNRTKGYIEDILESITSIEGYTKGISEKEFFDPANQQLQDAVVRRLEIIGEASKRLSKKVYDETTDIPWHDIASMRDRLIHEYDDVNLFIVWDTVTSRLTELKNVLEECLKNIEKQG